MNNEEFQDALVSQLCDDQGRHEQFGEYGPSQVSGCPLRVYLDEMTRHETIMNSWLFQGSAVHHYLQDTGILDAALAKAGYHPVMTDYEEHTQFHLEDDLWIDGTCDILARDDGERVIYDIKYSSLPAESGHGRIYKYFSQANAYAHMFGADDYGLIMINSTSQELREDIVVLPGQMSEENWEIVKDKTRNIHKALKSAGRHEDVEWTKEELDEVGVGFWEEIMPHFTRDRIPSHDKECNHCPHADYCPVNQNKLGNLNKFINGEE